MMNQKFFKKGYLAAFVFVGTLVVIGLNLPGRSVSEVERSGSAEVVGVVETISVRHAQGETEVPVEPGRVLVFDMAALDILNALGVEVEGVAGVRFPAYLSEYEKGDYLKIGSLFEPDYEVVHAARPDLMITGSRSSAKYESLAKVGTTIDLAVDGNRYLESVIENTEILARIFRKEAEGRELVADLRARVDGLKQVSAGRGNALIVMTSGSKMSAYGVGSRFGMIHSDFGIAAAVENLESSRHGESIHAEFVQKTNPDWLFVIDRDAAVGNEGAARQVLDNALVAQTTAWSKGQVVYLDSTNMYLVGGGVQALSQVIEQLSDAYRTIQN